MHRSVALRAVALLCLTAVFYDSGVIAEDHPILPELSSVRDILDLLGKLDEIGAKDKAIDLVVKEVQEFLSGSGLDCDAVRRNLQMVLDGITDMRGKLLTNPEGYGKYASFTATDVFVKDAAGELVYALPLRRSDLWILYMNTGSAGVRCLCYLSIIFNVPDFIRSRSPDGTLPSALKDVIDFLGKLNESPLKPKIVDGFDEKLRTHHTENGFKGKGVKINLTMILDSIPELRKVLLHDTEDYGKCSTFDPSEQNLNSYVTALTHRLPVLYNELWALYFNSSDMDLRRVCLMTLGLRGTSSFQFPEKDFIKGRPLKAKSAVLRHRYASWKLILWIAIILLLNVELSILYYKYSSSYRCDDCQQCQRCCRCHSTRHCCCFCLWFWRRAVCEHCQTCTDCKRRRIGNMIAIFVVQGGLTALAIGMTYYFLCIKVG